MNLPILEEPFAIFICPEIFFTQARAITHTTGNPKAEFYRRVKDGIIF